MAIFSSNLSRLMNVYSSASTIVDNCDTALKNAKKSHSRLESTLDYSGKAGALALIDKSVRDLQSQKEKMTELRKMILKVIEFVRDADRLEKYGTTDPGAGDVYVSPSSLQEEAELEAIEDILGILTGVVFAKISQQLDGLFDKQRKQREEAALEAHKIPRYTQWKPSPEQRQDQWGDYGDAFVEQGCNFASTAAALSGLLGISIKPKDVIDMNDDKILLNEKNVTKHFKDYQLKRKTTGWKENGYDKDNPNGSWNTKEEAQRLTQNGLDEAIERYRKDLDHYSAPIIDLQSSGTLSNHYMIITGKNDDGSYQIINTSGSSANRFVVDLNVKSQENRTITGTLSRVTQYSIP